MQECIKLFLKQHGNKVGGREVVLIYRDETGPAPDISKRLVQELVVSAGLAAVGEPADNLANKTGELRAAIVPP